MQRNNIIGFSCNWGPYACLNDPAFTKAGPPPGIGWIRVMCIGRINQALILQAFEYGADGVILLHCKEEDCRYGTGPEIGQTNIQRVRNLLHLLGIGQKRLIERSFAPTEQDLLMESLWEFHRLIQKMGSNPAKPRQERVAL